MRPKNLLPACIPLARGLDIPGLPHLPIDDKRSEIIDAIRSGQTTVIVGETGSGKTTRLPLLCLEAGLGWSGMIACTQPRRIAAISLAHYVAGLVQSAPGDLVGYKVRFNDCISSATRIAFVTDGILLAEITEDPLLSRYDTLIVDEAHERSLTIDFLLGYLRTLLPRRPNLKLIIASATMDVGLFARSFNHAPVITVSGRLFPVEIRYRPIIEMWDGESISSYIECVVTVVREIVDNEGAGDVLVFLPTVQDILEAVGRLRASLPATTTEVLPLYSRMTIEEQRRIFAPGCLRKIILATNIAETSITIPGIRFVVDTGLARTRWSGCRRRPPSSAQVAAGG
jgi:ATP-dependent helicase HrpA